MVSLWRGAASGGKQATDSPTLIHYTFDGLNPQVAWHTMRTLNFGQMQKGTKVGKKAGVSSYTMA